MGCALLRGKDQGAICATAKHELCRITADPVPFVRLDSLLVEASQLVLHTAWSRLIFNWKNVIFERSSLAQVDMSIQSGSNVFTCPDPSVDHLDRHGYLFGYPIAHSLSPLLHQTIYNGLGLRWGQLLLPSTDMSQFLRLLRDERLYGKPPPQSVAI